MASEVSKPENINSVLIILMGSIGDVVRGSCVLEPIKRANPDVKITWLVEPICAPLLKGSPLIDELLIFDRSRPVAGTIDIWRKLRSRQFDVVLDMQRIAKSGLFCLFSRAPRKIGFNKRDCKELNYIFQTETLASYGDSISKVDHYLKFVEALGCVVPNNVKFGLDHLKSEAPELLEELKPGSDCIGIVLGSSWETKNWTVEGYCRLIKSLESDRKLLPVLLGANEHKNIEQQILKGHSALSFVGRTNLRQLASIISRMSICVGPDSGPGHIAAAMGIPYVTLFGPTAPLRVVPYGSEHLALTSSVACSPCGRKTCPGLGKICMRLHSPERVKEKIYEAFA